MIELSVIYAMLDGAITLFNHGGKCLLALATWLPNSTRLELDKPFYLTYFHITPTKQKQVEGVGSKNTLCGIGLLGP